MRRKCPDCRRHFSSHALPGHWRESDCDANLSQWQKDILVALLMGDGSISTSRDDRVCSGMEVWMKTEEYIEWISSTFPHISTRMKKRDGDRLSKELSKHTGNEHDVSDQYGVHILKCPFIEKLSEWYSSGKKRFPEDLELNRRVVRHWYVCDGGIVWKSMSNCHPCITSLNEMDREDFIVSLFDRTPLDPSYSCGNISFARDSFFDYIGPPLPGFEYKWAYMDVRRYNKLKPGDETLGFIED